MSEYYTFKKPDADPAELYHMTPKMLLVFSLFVNYCKQKNLPVLVTNIKHKFPQSKSRTHPEGRAADFSVRGWTKSDIKLAIEYMNKVAYKYGAISASTGKPRPIVYHDVGLGAHFHLQVSPGNF